MRLGAVGGAEKWSSGRRKVFVPLGYLSKLSKHLIMCISTEHNCCLQQRKSIRKLQISPSVLWRTLRDNRQRPPVTKTESSVETAKIFWRMISSQRKCQDQFAYKLICIKAQPLFDFSIFVHAKHSFLDQRGGITMKFVKRNLGHLTTDSAG